MRARSLTDLQKRYSSKPGAQKNMPMRGPGPGRHGPRMKGKPKNMKKTVKRLFKYVSAYKFRLLFVLFLMLGNTLCSLVASYLLAPIINRLSLVVLPDKPVQWTGIGKLADSLIEKVASDLFAN